MKDNALLALLFIMALFAIKFFSPEGAAVTLVFAALVPLLQMDYAPRHVRSRQVLPAQLPVSRRPAQPVAYPVAASCEIDA